jgi:hypothetical protein
MMLDMLNPEVMDKLREHGIQESDYRFKMGRYHDEGRKGVPYRMLVIRKSIPAKEQTDLELELRGLDETLCVIFKKYTK